MQSKAETLRIRGSAVPPAHHDALCAMNVAMRYRPALIRFFQRRSTFFASEAEDLTQEVFLRLLQRSRSGEIARVEGYIFQIASSVLVDRARSAASRRGADHRRFEEAAHATEASIGPDRLIEGRQDIEVVKAT